ncbi:D-hexose-6-phosphate mutarotase [Mariprofundus erugo]|uniref:D-hexose-6-phosphate mutarotase n=1 Tax=Mariprofundus erugo TaxID=2528639 RepID=UPI0010FCF675|nr:D-hexose-6-phosphate mutarotase [Mariprofundus erugo]TLS77572.1 D-hexose-6-phosphate mutarotase [Mariprofundus erugo]
MSIVDELNKTFGLTDQITFLSGPAGMAVVEIENSLGCASMALQGAHLVGFQAMGEQPLIWMSDEAVFAPGKSLRGGVPVCWPWFGPHATDSSLPGHGPARTVEWKPVASSSLEDGRTSISFEMVETDATRRQCAHPLRVQLHVTVGSTLQMTLETTNLGTTPFTLGDALHTYFLVGDVRQAQVEGLDGCDYLDKVAGGKHTQQGAVTIASEVDRIYLGTGHSCAIVDPVMGRRILIRSEGSASTIVWNPWIEKTLRMGDLGPDGYLKMLCVETANAADDVVELAAGATHRLAVEYSSEAL